MDFSDRLVNAGYAACALIVFGSLAPWAAVGDVTRSGVDGEGMYTLLLALFAGFVLWRWSEFPKSEFLVGLAILAGICVVATGYFLFSIESILDLPGVAVSWGLQVALAGSVALLAIAGLLYRRDSA